MHHTVLSAPGFSLGIHCSDQAITRIEFLPPQASLSAQHPLLGQAVAQLTAWLDDPRQRFSLPLANTGTPFQKRVWAAISAVTLGDTRSYGDLAHALQTAPRAVGQACGANPFPIITPCHRIIARDGGLGGFNRQGGGFLLDIKRWLLAHEHTRR